MVRSVILSVVILNGCAGMNPGAIEAALAGLSSLGSMRGSGGVVGGMGSEGIDIKIGGSYRETFKELFRDEIIIPDWQKDPTVRFVSLQPWADNAGVYRMVVFQETAKPCVVMESIRGRNFEALVYSTSICELEYRGAIWNLSKGMHIPQERIKWREDEQVGRTTDRTSLNFELIEPTLRSRHLLCRISYVSAGDNKIHCVDQPQLPEIISHKDAEVAELD